MEDIGNHIEVNVSYGRGDFVEDQQYSDTWPRMVSIVKFTISSFSLV